MKQNWFAADQRDRPNRIERFPNLTKEKSVCSHLHWQVFSLGAAENEIVFDRGPRRPLLNLQEVTSFQYARNRMKRPGSRKWLMRMQSRVRENRQITISNQ